MVMPAMVAGASPSSAPPATSDGTWIVYNGSVGGGSGIRLVTTDGSDDHAAFEGLTPGEQWHPDWSPDGLSIAFAADDTDGTRDLWVGSIDGSSAERIYDCAAPCGWTDDPAWSPDGGSILFQRGSAVGDAGMGVGTVDVIDLESRTVTTLATGAETEYFYVPRWAPDMSAVVVEVDRFDSGRLDAQVVVSSTLAVIDLSGASPAVRELLPVDRRAIYPDWGATGTIVFQAPLDPASPDGPSDLYTIDPAGGDATRVTTVGDGGRQALQPTWTPDGSRIIFVEQDGPFQNVRMATILPDGTGLTSATAPTEMFGTHPRLQPGGTPPTS
jgi:Tol biopolymer transport system component